jgi:tripartite-type tricarboxylate transporter receptor subunit TctC
LLCPVLAAMAMPAAGAAPAQDNWPSKPVRMIVPFTPGSASDVTGRILAQRLTEIYGQQMVADNRPGAGGLIGSQLTRDAAPDGYTIAMIGQPHLSNALLRADKPYDPLKDYVAIGLTAITPNVIVLGKGIEVKTIPDLIALAKAKPGLLNYSSAGIGSGTHFAVETLKAQAGIDVVHVPFKGIPEALAEAVAGRVQFFMAPFATAIGLVKDGRAKAIAVTSPKRVGETPNIPTVAESGVPGYKYAIWSGLLAPAKTPRALVEQLNAEVVRILRLPETAQRLAPLGTEAAPGTPEEFDRLIAEEVAGFTRLARAANIKVE